ncbi:hypothetical protein LTR10_009380 [Elasticomyces elasticus]|nr:hypothetical protein LTR10_009380 [Elasticomyces elasticus]KAK4971521.1 hypothetical protein LTR42_007249 [Elasticomyces elasticus]
MTTSKQISVGIVGAGLAGLRCADVLLQHGCKVTIFEARNRLGGRVAQSDHLGHKVDLGPNWIHGTDNNPILQIARETGTQLHTWDEDSVLIGSNGNTLNAAEADEYSSLLWDDGLIAQAFRYSNENKAIDPQRSLHDFFVEKMKGLFMDQPEQEATRKRATLLQVGSMWGAYIGSAVTKQSLKYFWLEECIHGENPFVAGTYGKILDAIAKPAQVGANIKLGAEVVRIESSDEGRSIQLVDGSTYSFDDVVVTAPLGWLKRNKDAFRPNLPLRLSQAIDNIGYGTLDKVYITFPSAFWDARSQGSIHETDATARTTIGTKATATAGTTSSPQSAPGERATAQQYASFIHWLAPTYTKNNPGQWDPQAINLAALSTESAHPTLLFYIYGPCSEHIAHLVTSAESTKDRDAGLLDFFQPYYSRLPNYDTSDLACTPTAVLATAWANDKFAGHGSYSNFQVGLEEGDVDIETMRHGMPEHKVWLAGEHTAPFVALGTSTGAWWSGEAVADGIVRAYGLAKK